MKASEFAKMVGLDIVETVFFAKDLEAQGYDVFLENGNLSENGKEQLIRFYATQI